MADQISSSRSGRFITFEGADGTGKSTQIAQLAERLRAHGRAGRSQVVTTREPGGSPFAERVRAVLLSPDGPERAQRAELLAFCAARADHVDRVIAPALEAGKWVLCDRFTDSTRVYQGLSGAFSADELTWLDRFSTGGLVPELTLVLDVPVDAARERVSERSTAQAQGDRPEDVTGDAAPPSSAPPSSPPLSAYHSLPDPFEAWPVERHAAVADAFRQLADREPQRIALIDGKGSVIEVAERVWDCVGKRFPEVSA